MFVRSLFRFGEGVGAVAGGIVLTCSLCILIVQGGHSILQILDILDLYLNVILY